MPRIKQIVKTSYIDIAKRIRHCKHNKTHEILKDQQCLVIKEQMNSASYCSECAREIIVQGIDSLRNLQGQLE